MRPHIRTQGVRGTRDRPNAWRVLAVVLLLSLVVLVSGRIVEDGDPQGWNPSASEVSRAVVYLTRFGYLPPSDPKTGNLRSESEFKEAVAAMQRFGGLPATGRIDQATVELMGRRRCGVPDYLSSGNRKLLRRRRYAIQGQKWPNTDLTWSVRSESSDADMLPMVRAQLRRAFGVWSEASALTFSEVDRSADILVSFLKGPHGDGYPFDGEGSVLAHAFFPGEGIGGDAHFDAEERWTPAQPEDDDGVNLFAVAAHEIGHSLGLSHSSTPGSLMFPYYQAIGDDRFRLPEDDADGIRLLYGTRKTKKKIESLPPTVPAPATSTTPAAGQPKSTPVWTTTGPTSSPTPPDICNSSIDAISVIRREIFVFKGNYFWRLHDNRTLRSGYPVPIDRFWYDLPSHIDALYERPTDTKIIFFSGRSYWLFSANRLESGYPKPLTELGLPDDVDRVDAATVWGHNGKTYLFSGDRYWKLDEDEGRVELDYPRSLTAAWRGVPTNIDAAFQWSDGNTYFFKKNKFWKFVDVKMRVENKSPSEIGGFWFQCPSETVENGAVTSTMSSPMDAPEGRQSSAAVNSSTIHITPYLFCLLFVIHFWRGFVTQTL